MKNSGRIDGPESIPAELYTSDVIPPSTSKRYSDLVGPFGSTSTSNATSNNLSAQTPQHVNIPIPYAQMQQQQQIQRMGYPYKSLILALGLLLAGTILLIIGTTTWYQDTGRGIALVTVGGVCFLPGGYALYMMYYGLKGMQGYDIRWVYEW
mmetsp:Transcript_8197/g.14601  ORF Transcript_8197/g.14601 Transcript_8197/m.14601 type:complete len:152 (+) Transcript_8197:217-672(+)